MIKYKAIAINEKWADKLNDCAEVFAISGSRMAQFALFYCYKIESSKTQLRSKFEDKRVYWVSIPFEEKQAIELKEKLKTSIRLSFADVLRRSIEVLHEDLFNPLTKNDVKESCRRYIGQK